MKCQRCHGFGREPRDIAERPGHYQLIPCPECNGCGTTSCCGDAMAEPDNHDAPQAWREAKKERDEGWER